MLYNKHYKKILISIVIALFIEIFICNFPAFRTIINGNYIENVSFTKEQIEIRISDIGTRVTSINIEFEKAIPRDAYYYLTCTGSNTEEKLITKTKTIPKDSMEAYINFDTVEECEKLILSIQTTIGNSEQIKIKNISLNKPNFNISIVRIIILYVITLFIAYLKDGSIYNIKYDKNSKSQHRKFMLFLVGICIFITLHTIGFSGFEKLYKYIDEVNQTDATLMQTEAFLNKSVKLLIKPTKELLEMENPYDYGKKEDNTVLYLFDVAYYNGAYYSYYGLAPILLLVLPFRIITGFYLQSYIFNLPFMFAIIFLLYSIYKKMVDTYTKDISLFHFYAGYIVMLSASNVTNLLTGRKYEIAISSGIACILLSIRLAMSINEWTKFKNLKFVLLRF